MNEDLSPPPGANPEPPPVLNGWEPLAPAPTGEVGSGPSPAPNEASASPAPDEKSDLLKQVDSAYNSKFSIPAPQDMLGKEASPPSATGEKSDLLNKVDTAYNEKFGIPAYKDILGIGADKKSMDPEELEKLWRNINWAEVAQRSDEFTKLMAEQVQLEQLRKAIEGASPEQAVSGAVMSLLDFTQIHPDIPIVNLGLKSAEVVARATTSKDGVVPDKVLDFAMQMIQMKAQAQSSAQAGK